MLLDDLHTYTILYMFDIHIYLSFEIKAKVESLFKLKDV